MTLPDNIFGIDTKKAYEEFIAEAEKKEETTEPVIITPAHINNPEQYIILEARTHGTYSYPDILIDRERSHQGTDWFQAHEALHQENAVMLTIRQYVDFINLLKSGKAFDGGGNKVPKQKLDDILDDMLTKRNPYRAEWLDADFKLHGKLLYIHYNHRTINNKLEPQTKEQLDPNTLMQDKTPGISLEDWLKNATFQGLSHKNIQDGDLYYWFPRSGNNSVAWFGADADRVDLGCDGNPQSSSVGLGVRRALNSVK